MGVGLVSLACFFEGNIVVDSVSDDSFFMLPYGALIVPCGVTFAAVYAFGRVWAHFVVIFTAVSTYSGIFADCFFVSVFVAIQAFKGIGVVRFDLNVFETDFYVWWDSWFLECKDE